MTYGATFSQSATPIDRAPDYQRILDTRWKTMSIVATMQYDNADYQFGPKIVKLLDHNLGYLPAFEAPFFNTRYEVQSTAAGSYAFVADRTSIYFVKGHDPATTSLYAIHGNINVYDLNIEEDFDSKSKGTITPSTKTSMGMKIIGNDEYAAKNVGDKGALGYAVTTESKAFGIVKVDEVTITGATFIAPSTATIDHDLQYPPLIKLITTDPLQLSSPFPFLPRPSTSPVFCGPMGIGFTANNLSVKAETNRLIVQSSTNGTYRYVIFREPTEIAG